MENIRRGFLYLNGALLFVFGLTALLAPHIINEQIQLMPASIAGTSETRGLYGGGFISFAILILVGLRYQHLASGFLLSMAIIMLCIVVGRVISLGLDREFATAVPAIISELLLALACWWESKETVHCPPAKAPTA